MNNNHPTKKEVSDWFLENNLIRPELIVVSATMIQCRFSVETYPLSSLLKFSQDFKIKPENIELVVDDYTTWMTVKLGD